MGGSGERSPSKDLEKKNFQLSKFVITSFFTWKTQPHWGLETAVCSIFVKPVLDIFAVCSLVPSMNLSHRQQSYLCPKNQNYSLERADLKAISTIKQ